MSVVSNLLLIVEFCTSWLLLKQPVQLSRILNRNHWISFFRMKPNWFSSGDTDYFKRFRKYSMSIVDYELCHPYSIHHAETWVTWLFMITCRGHSYQFYPPVLLRYLFSVSYLRYLEKHYYIILTNHILFYDFIKKRL